MKEMRDSGAVAVTRWKNRKEMSVAVKFDFNVPDRRERVFYAFPNALFSREKTGHDVRQAALPEEVEQQAAEGTILLDKKWPVL
jgi:hypothetical protein